MTKLAFVFAVFATAALAGPVRADDAAAKRAEAQKQIDLAKVKGCEALKVSLGKNKSCPDQGAAAAKVTCTPAAFAEITALNGACVQILKDKVAAAKDKAAATRAPRTPDATTIDPKAIDPKAIDPKAIDPKAATRPCKATDEAGAAVAELETPKLSACMKEVRAAGKSRCAPGVRKYKVNYQWGTSKPMTMTVFCPR